ncbi:class I SAM-dependent methyltransferase [Pseudomonas argentinensis]|uniref:class I SAM-dependent methyltransferase n=1 Tax=Phytopseudomonas argentinensis TaxID=289370 RepID=UPI000B008478|nr:class I SAM-dependent methyltransferase [Pseudomonas argentinensis]
MDVRRIKGRPVAIDYESTQAFFESRGQRQYANLLSATMYQDEQPELVAARDLAEKQRVSSVLALTDIGKVFDIGCGVGRWGWFLAEHYPELRYLGVDFSASLIEQAQREAASRDLGQLAFQIMSATSLQPNDLQLPAPFDLLLISGLLIYLNDADCAKVLRDAALLCAPGGAIYLREPVGIEERFTLDRFYSSELAEEYSAIYRTVEELHGLMAEALKGTEVAIEQEDVLFADSLEKRAETRQYFFILRRAGGSQ